MPLSYSTASDTEGPPPPPPPPRHFPVFVIKTAGAIKSLCTLISEKKKLSDMSKLFSNDGQVKLTSHALSFVHFDSHKGDVRTRYLDLLIVNIGTA